MKTQYFFYLRSNLGSLKLHGFINEMLRIPYILDETVKGNVSRSRIAFCALYAKIFQLFSLFP
jgi:hypothetical protein